MVSVENPKHQSEFRSSKQAWEKMESRGYHFWRVSVMSVFLVRPVLALLLHAQLVLPTRLYPETLIAFHAWYCNVTGDPILTNLYPWFQCLVLMLLFIQAPFELWSAYQFTNGKLEFVPYIPLYAAHALTCIGPSIFEIMFGNHYASGEYFKIAMAVAPKLYDTFCILMVRAFFIRYHSHLLITEKHD